MNPELITSWTDHDSSLQKVLLLARRCIRIFDADLARLRLETPENALFLRRLLTEAPRNTLQIVVRDAEPFRRNSPRLMKLLADFPASMHVRECAPQIASLTDSLLLSDDCHALVRFHQDHARARAIIDNADACRPYLLRFEQILAEGGTPVSATTLGL